jgi:predicted anti-sigma-YlaC factor YlaD
MDGALAGRHVAALDLHLVGCERCRATAERMERTWRSLGALAPVPQGPDDWSAIAANASRTPPQRLVPWARWRVHPSLAATSLVIAVAAAVGAAGGVLLSRTPGGSGTVFEATVLGETMGVLGWHSPAARFAHGIDGPAEVER